MIINTAKSLLASTQRISDSKAKYTNVTQPNPSYGLTQPMSMSVLIQFLGRRAFRVYGPATLNALPTELRTAAVSLSGTFAKRWKTHFICLF